MKLIHKKLLWLIGISIAFISTSCTNKLNNKFWWEAGISAPKYYPIGDVKVDLEFSGNSSLTNFDNGWGHRYGSIVSGEKYKELPKHATIQYYSAVENLKYEGTIPLPYDRILELFNQYCTNKEKDQAILVVGMAPGGWIRVWADFTSNQNGVLLIEVAKAKLKGKEDNTIEDGFRYKESNYWDKYKTYWQHFGIPYDAWAENEKQYDINFTFNKPNPNYNVNDAFYSSLDGTIYYNITNDEKMYSDKLPADLVISWGSKKDSISYDTHVLMPKNFKKIVESKKTNDIEIALEIEENEQFGKLYLITKNKKEEILRFKNTLRTKPGVGESDICKEVEYFMK